MRFISSLTKKKHFFDKIFPKNIWRLYGKFITLHSLYKTSHLASYLKHLKKAFFEEIYINREVVQEASVWFYIKWMGKRNEPINSLSLLLRHRLKTIRNKRKGAFYLILLG